MKKKTIPELPLFSLTETILNIYQIIKTMIRMNSTLQIFAQSYYLILNLLIEVLANNKTQSTIFTNKIS